MKKLGFGCMRLPVIDGKSGNVDKKAFCEMIDAFLEKGFSYFDTAWFYHESKSEIAVGECLVDRYPRDSFRLADKMPVKLIKEQKELDEYFFAQLEKCHVEYFDYYLLHDLGREVYDKVTRIDAFGYILQKKNEGKIKNIGFSFHDTADVLDKILTDHPEVDFVQLQINYLDWKNSAIQSEKCYNVACKHNKKVIVMEPVKGGTLANLPQNAEKILKKYSPDNSVASWAIRYCASLENVFMVLSGMSDMHQLEDNISYMENFVSLNEKEYELIENITDIINSNIAIPCTGCAYCINGCPSNINIPALFSLYNAEMQEDKTKPFTVQQVQYSRLTSDCGKASDCIGCGACEAMCPQHIEIRSELEKITQLFE